MKNTSIRQGSKLASCEVQNEQESLEKNLLQGKAQNNGQEKENNSCSDTGERKKVWEKRD